MGILFITMILTAGITSCGNAGSMKTGSAVPGASASAEQTPGREETEPHDRQLFAMTTIMNLRAYGGETEKALDAAEKEIRKLDDELSISNPSSEVYAVNKNGGGRLTEDAGILAETSLELSQATEGAFDFTIAPLMDLWGFSTLYSEESESSPEQVEADIDAPPTAEEISGLLPYVDYKKVSYDSASGELKLANGQKIDFGGIAKGYTSQKVMEIYKKYGVTGGLAELGGNVQVMGVKPDGTPWRVGIEDPGDTSQILGVLSLNKDSTVITSGGYERYLKDRDGNVYQHILDPSTGYPADNGLTSVSVVMDNGTMADGLSTALYVMGEDRAIDFWRTHANTLDLVLMTEDGRLLVTEGIANSFGSDRYKPEVINKDET